MIRQAVYVDPKAFNSVAQEKANGDKVRYWTTSIIGENLALPSCSGQIDVDVDEWRVGDKCWRIITRFHNNNDENVHEYSVSMYLLDWNSRPYVYDYNLTSAMATDKLHFLIKINIDDNTWDIEEILDPTS